MMSNNKILTVSYGTFSCTLEGFDDSFGTMKAIAEYFRDLSSEDRYFGAEPAQPDAEMLARIAQKEISRRVEAREQDGKIVLSATKEQTVSALLTGTATAAGVAQHNKPEFDTSQRDAEEVEQGEPTANADRFADVETEEVVAEEAAADTGSADEPVDQFEAESFIAEVEEPADQEPAELVSDETLDEDEAPLPTSSKEEFAPSSPAVEAMEEDTEEDTDQDASFAVLRRAQASTPKTLEMDGAEYDIVPGQSDADVSSFFSQSDSAANPDMGFADTTDVDISDTLEEAEIAEPVATPVVAKAQNESIADKLQRIRDVVAQSDTEDTDPDYDEVEPVVQTAPEKAQTAALDEEDDSENAVILAALRDIKGALAADDETQAQAEVVFEETHQESIDDTDDAELDDILARLQQSDDAEEADEHDDLVQDEAVDLMDEDGDDDASGNIFDANGSDDEATAPEQAEDVKADTDVVLEAEDIPQVPRARVIKVKRVALQAAIETGELEEIEDDLAPEAKSEASSLNAAQEAELAEELAALESDLNDVEDTIQGDAFLDDDIPDEVLDQVAAQKSVAARETLPSIDEGQNPDMNRLMDETDQQMDEPENATRRNAFAHLRAAVAAKKADFAMGGRDDTETEGEAYRDDLAEVVRPRRPVGGSQRTPRPNTARPAPLKLVAEQRIDTDVQPATTSNPVRPRRVAAVSEEVATDADAGFAEFAAEMGAVKLPELLEAAAAYMSFVEGRDQFSRPQLMHRVRQVEQTEFSREDGLRWFGKLLRDGKIQKISGGRFQVSEQIGFKPDERAVG